MARAEAAPGWLRLGWRWGHAAAVALLGAIADRWRANPVEAMAVLYAVARAFARTVDTGFVGIVYRFGRVRRVAEPGLVWLIPGVDQLQAWPVQATTMELQPQRVEMADGLVFEVVVTLVVRLGDPVRAAVEVDDCWRGCRVMAALAAREVLAGRRRAAWGDREALDDALQERVAERLSVWGVVVERAAFALVSPDRPTRRITLIDALTGERRRVYGVLREGGAQLGPALGMLGGQRQLVSRSSLAYRDHEPRREVRTADNLQRPVEPRVEQEAAAPPAPALG
jgi:hypothetical protein